MRNKSPRGLLNTELAAVEWSQRDTLTVLRAAKNGGRTVVKRKMVLAMAMVLTLCMLTSCALAATLIFSPRYDALQLANQALLDKYGITEEMLPALTHTIRETEDATIVTYEIVENLVMRENRFGSYTVTIRDGNAEAVWTMDGMDTSGGLDAPAWGAEQLKLYVADYNEVMSYMMVRDMLMNVEWNIKLFQQRTAAQERARQTALSMAKISLEDAAAIGREAIAVRYGLDAKQLSTLIIFSGEDEDQSTYMIVNDRPLVSLYFHLTQKPGEWQEKDGIYVVTVNLLDGAVEDILYDTGLMGNG